MVATVTLVVPALCFVEVTWRPPLTLHFIAWPLLCAAISLILLPRVKGAVLALQWALRIHGFVGRRNAKPTVAERRE